jgi:hypothetical protein
MAFVFLGELNAQNKAYVRMPVDHAITGHKDAVETLSIGT